MKHNSAHSTSALAVMYSEFFVRFSRKFLKGGVKVMIVFPVMVVGMVT
jgi:hypothetical protein